MATIVEVGKIHFPFQGQLIIKCCCKFIQKEIQQW